MALEKRKSELEKTRLREAHRAIHKLHALRDKISGGRKVGKGWRVRWEWGRGVHQHRRELLSLVIHRP